MTAILARRDTPRWSRGRASHSATSAGMSTRPIGRVAAATAPARAAAHQWSRRANQKENRTAARKSDSLYGARKKKEVGMNAATTTVRRAISTENSADVRACITTRAIKNAKFE